MGGGGGSILEVASNVCIWTWEGAWITGSAWCLSGLSLLHLKIASDTQSKPPEGTGVMSQYMKLVLVSFTLIYPATRSFNSIVILMFARGTCAS